MTKKIICYGDSNTFGFNPADMTRFEDGIRWTSILARNLGSEYKILEEGLNNRTGFVTNSDGFLYTAQRHFPKLMSKNKDTDILVLGLGTNDLQFLYDISFKTVEYGLEKLIQISKDCAKRIILIPPVILSEVILSGYFKIQFDETSISKSKKVGRIYKKLANIYGCEIFDINSFASPSDIDGLHYDKPSHKLIGDKLAEFIRKDSESGK